MQAKKERTPPTLGQRVKSGAVMGGAALVLSVAAAGSPSIGGIGIGIVTGGFTIGVLFPTYRAKAAAPAGSRGSLTRS